MLEGGCQDITEQCESTVRGRLRQYPPRHAAFRGEMMRHVMGCFRLAEGKPITTRDIAKVVMEARGLNPNDAEMLTTIRRRVGACIWNLKEAGTLKEVESLGDVKQWVLA